MIFAISDTRAAEISDLIFSAKTIWGLIFASKRVILYVERKAERLPRLSAEVRLSSPIIPETATAFMRRTVKT